MTIDQQPEISRSIFREANDAFFILRPDDLRILDVNPAAQRLTGRRRKELLALSLQDLVETQGAEAISELIQACRSTSYFLGSEGYLLKKEDGSRAIQLSASRIHTEPETLALLVVRDVSRRKALEEQLHHVRRMEAIGRLSAGVAHEFNNLLTIINGYSALLLENGTDEAMTGVLEIKKAGERAADFTRQLLDFGSRQGIETRVLDLCEVVVGMERMLVPLLGEGIEVATKLESDGLFFEADRGRIEQLLVNLAANARDAMPTGGRLTIETFRVELNSDDVASLPGLARGPHVLLRVSDTGCGMDSPTISRAFEPFFTTKKSEDGTGLGLAMVYSAVKQSRGHVAVTSRPEEGTTFTIHFPATNKAMTPSDSNGAPAEPPQTGTENVLLVEDDESVLRLVKGVLERAGYTVLPSCDGKDALATSERHDGPIHLVLTDFLMPGMRGDELGRRLTAARPDVRVLYMSGCVNLEGTGEDPEALGSFIRKPFSLNDLVRRVRTELDR